MEKAEAEFYGKYAPILVEKEAMIREETERILKQLTTDPEHAPAEHLRSRIKGAQSLQAKLVKQGYPEDARTGLLVLSDLIGMRIVTHFIGDVYLIEKELEQSACWKIVQVKDYISNPKPNGYRSLHVIIEIPLETEDLPSMRAEIQLRTIAMDCWASLEHQLKYKKDIQNTELIVRELKRCADEIASTDLSLQTIRDLIGSDTIAN